MVIETELEIAWPTSELQSGTILSNPFSNLDDNDDDELETDKLLED